MGLEILTLGSSKTYTRESLLGGGAVVGKNVTVSSINPIDGGNRVAFSYTLDDGTVKTSTMDVMDGKDGKAPSITIEANDNWFVDGIDTGIKAKGEKGDTGSGFNTTRQYSSVSDMVADTNPANDSEIVVVVLGDVGNFYMRLSSYVDPDGITNGYLPIGSAQDISTIKGEPGKDGTDGITPHIDSATKHWFLGTTDTGIKAEGADGTDGEDGVTPHIDSVTKHWMIGSQDTSIIAEGQDGKDGVDGITPHIDATTKHWFIGDTDTGILARGKDGANGYSPTATITKTETKSILTVTDINGTTSVDVSIDPVEHTNTESGIEDTPVGHIIPYMGNNAPKHYLICDGHEYNIIDYPYLVQHFTDEFGSSNFFGGDGTTTFAVPDLRGEFLRGTGVNYHANQGSGSDVGEHQDGTEHIYFGVNTSTGELWTDTSSPRPGGTQIGISKTDSMLGLTTQLNNKGYRAALSTWDGATNQSHFTSRPTNTSVLYCIKYEPTYFMKYTNQYAGFHDTVLFDGDASAVGSYTLADDITNYDYILVEISSGHSNTNFVPASNTNAGKATRLIKVYDIHIASRPNLGSDQFIETQWFEAAKPWYYFLSYWFISSTQFWIDEIYYNNLLNPRIKKITGIKGGA